MSQGIHGGFESLVSSEHLYRQATREQGVLNLGMQRIDVRCSALESISTQATLVAGFAFGSLQPDVLDTLTSTDAEETLVQMYIRQTFAAAFVACSAVAFAASIWVIYMALYVVRDRLARAHALSPPTHARHVPMHARDARDVRASHVARVMLM